MSNSKISLSLDIQAGNAPKVVKDLGQSFENTARKAGSLANHIGEVASYQEVQTETSKAEISTIQNAIKVQQDYQKKASSMTSTYKTNIKLTRQYKTDQTNLKYSTINLTESKKAEQQTTEQLNKAEQDLTNSMKASRREARESKKALDALKAARSGNFNEAVKLQRKIDENVAHARALQQQVQHTNAVINSIMAVAITGFSFKGLYDVSQNYIQLSNSLKLVATDGENVKKTLSDIFDVANKAQQPVDATAEAFLTLKKNTTKLGISQKELLSLSSTLSKSIAIGGSSADAAKNSMIQFGQALSLGKLSGQNFNSVAEQTPGLIQAIAQGLHMSAADLKNFANSGKLTTELIVQALKNAEQQTNETFNKLGNTINGSLNILHNRFTALVGENDFFSQKAASAILLVANNIKLITGAVVVATAAVVGFKAQQFLNYISETGVASLKSAKSMKAYAASIDATGGSFTLAGIKQKAFAIGTKATTLAVGTLTIGWRAFNAVVKASVIGAILAAAVYAVEKLIDGISWLYNKWKEWKSEADATQQVQYKTVSAHINALKVDINDQQKALKLAQDNLEKLRSSIKLDSNGQITQNIGLTSKIAKEIIHINELKQNIQKNQKELIELQKQAANETKKASDTVKKNSDTPDIVISATPKADPNLTAFINNIKNLKDQVRSARLSYDNLINTGKTTLSNFDQLNLKLKSATDGYRNLTRSQINQLISLNKQLDTLKENTAFTDQENKIQKQNDLLQFQLSLGDLSEQQRQQAISSYQLEQSIITATLGMTQEHAKKIAEMMKQTYQLQESVKRVQEENAHSFSNMIQQQIPTWQSFKTMLSNDVGKLADQFANWMIDGKANFKDMAKSMIRDFVAMTIKAAALTATIEVGNAITGGGLTAALKTLGGFSKLLGFESGGYTGDVPTNAVAGVVHGKEYVINANAVSRFGKSFFDDINRGLLRPTNSYNNQNIVNNNDFSKRVAQPKITIINNAPADVKPEYRGDEMILSIEPRIKRVAYDTAVQVYHEMSKYD